MEECGRQNLTKREVELLQRFRSRLKEIEDEAISRDIVGRDTNKLDFYRITPKEELPIYLQKMRFQTLHLKEKDITSTIKVFSKENRNPTEAKLRNKIKQQGQLMLLSEIYQHLGENGPQTPSANKHPLPPPNDLDDWEKQHKTKKAEGLQFRAPRQSASTEKSFAKGCDYKLEIEKGLEIIEVTHGSETNLLTRYLLIENSSKLLKKDLEEKKMQVEESIKTRMKLLYQARTEYHLCFEEKNRIYLEEKMLRQEPKDELLRLSHKSISAKTDKTHKKGLAEVNLGRIARTKKNIEGLEEAIAHLEEELKKIIQAENLYFRLTLKNGVDVRESGLVWVVQKLEIREPDITQYEFPAYLDKRGRLFLIQKAGNEEEKEALLQEKVKFVNEIGRTTSENKFKLGSLIGSPKQAADKIVEKDYRVDSNIPKRYRRSQRKLSALAQEFIKEKSLLDLRGPGCREVEISGDLEGKTHKEIYNQVGERIKRLDLSKLKKEKLGTKGGRLVEYQSLLEKIKCAHIKLEEMDYQHESYLLTQYRDNRNMFFMQAAACFGYKRAYSMIIKHYSWKNYNHPHPK